jgi:hypothetical protein
LQSTTPRDLETVCLKCLRKEPHKRYATAEELAADLERFLAGETVRARPVPAWERAARWARRRPTAAALVLLTITATAGALFAWWAFTQRLEQERDKAVKQEARATELKDLYEKESKRADEEKTTAWKQRDEAVHLLEVSVAAVRDHAWVVEKGKQADLRTANPGEVLFQLACAYARSSEKFRTDTGLQREHAMRLSSEYADGAVELLKSAEQIGFFDKKDDNCNCDRLRDQKDLQLLKGRSDFQQLILRRTRDVATPP